MKAVAWVTDADVRDFGCGDGESVFLFAKSGKWNRPLYSQATVDTLRAQLEAAQQVIAEAATTCGQAQARAEAAEAECARLREDAERWQHARMLLTIDDIEGAQGAFDSFGQLISEEECARADAAIDAARTKEQQA